MTLRWNVIAFDLDNTLFSHEDAFQCAIKGCYERFLKRNQMTKKVSSDEFFSVFKQQCDTYWPEFESKELTKIAYRRKRFIKTMELLSLPASEEEADRFHRDYDDTVDDYSEPYPELTETLQYLDEQGVMVAVITNGKHETQLDKLRKIGALEWIPKENVFISDEVGIAKPDPGIFQYAEKLLAPSGESRLFVGDSWEHDVVGAIDAGWEAIYLNTRGTHPSTNHQPLKQFTHFEALSSWIRDHIHGQRGHY
ncbi:HAD family hydrolase [Texcoconibacillus texcoconensis]|uniref:HAD superfamily hydrolase (TIGR01549 family) n=1 Tax=Texcoconibacillus texcoconensis TaxID=1095777 RepID=A0A840QP78_9BACI|nr:HAD family hydrolase [Texcoconibacillus texcoconensis]MBB5173127.1 HAD superfamily hydrolase (TIGR01549 family) [Texcoconibacillus texcoconensis]